MLTLVPAVSCCCASWMLEALGRVAGFSSCTTSARIRRAFQPQPAHFLVDCKGQCLRPASMPRIAWTTSPPNDGFPGLRKRLANPCGQRPTTGIAQCPHRCSNAAIVSEVVLNSRLLLRLRVLGTPACIAHRQIETLLVFLVPALQGILGWITQLTNGRPDAFAELDEEFDRSNPIFVRIRELPPGSSRFCPHPPRGRSQQKSILYA